MRRVFTKSPSISFLIVLLMAGNGKGENILLNPSFELWMDTLGVNIPVGWLSSELLHPGSAVKDTNSHTGNYCVHLIGSDTSAFVTTATLVRSGYHYEFSGYAWVPGVLGGSFVLQFLGITGNPIGSPQLLPVYYSFGYRHYSYWVTAPDSAVFLSVSCITLPSAELYVDDITLADTTLSGINEEQQTMLPINSQKRKVIIWGKEKTIQERSSVFDVLGRRVTSTDFTPGVYFLID